MKEIGNTKKQETGRWPINRGENSYLPIRRRERAMLRFRSKRILQKFAAVHYLAEILFNLERHLHPRANFKINRAASLAELRALGAA